MCTIYSHIAWIVYGKEKLRVIEARRLEVNRASPATSQGWYSFVRQGGEALSSTTKQWSLLSPGGNWDLRADLDWPAEASSADRNNFPAAGHCALVLYHKNCHNGGADSYHGKMAWSQLSRGKGRKYAELAAACIEAVWRAFIYPVEVGWPGVHWKHLLRRLLKSLGIRGASWQRRWKSWRRRQSKGASGSGFGERTRCGKRRILRLAAGGGRETSLPPLHHPEDVPGWKERNIDDGCLPADDPAASANGTGGGVSGRCLAGMLTCAFIWFRHISKYIYIYIYLYLSIFKIYPWAFFSYMHTLNIYTNNR